MSIRLTLSGVAVLTPVGMLAGIRDLRVNGGTVDNAVMNGFLRHRGIISATVPTLLVIPALYHWIRRRDAQREVIEA